MPEIIKAVISPKYGKNYVYVVNKQQREAIELLTQRKTLSQEMVQGLRNLGFQVEIEDTRPQLEM